MADVLEVSSSSLPIISLLLLQQVLHCIRVIAVAPQGASSRPGPSKPDSLRVAVTVTVPSDGSDMPAAFGPANDSVHPTFFESQGTHQKFQIHLHARRDIAVYSINQH
jgi:hypothetical protein